jgi:hypothetical protein
MSQKRNVFIGLDPGKAGFIAIYDFEGNLADPWEFLPMPEKQVSTGRQLKSGKDIMKWEFDPEGFRSLFFHIWKKYKDCNFIAAIEDVNGRQGWSASNNFAFGHTAGLQYMLLIMLKADIEIVRPQKWQSVMYKGFEKTMKSSQTGKTKVHDTKATSAIVAQALAPNINFCRTERSKVIDDNKTDAFLICLYRFKRY